MSCGRRRRRCCCCRRRRCSCSCCCSSSSSSSCCSRGSSRSGGPIDARDVGQGIGPLPAAVLLPLLLPLPDVARRRRRSSAAAAVLFLLFGARPPGEPPPGRGLLDGGRQPDGSLEALELRERRVAEDLFLLVLRRGRRRRKEKRVVGKNIKKDRERECAKKKSGKNKNSPLGAS